MTDDVEREFRNEAHRLAVVFYYAILIMVLFGILVIYSAVREWYDYGRAFYEWVMGR